MADSPPITQPPQLAPIRPAPIEVAQGGPGLRDLAPTERLRPPGALYAIDLLRFAAAVLVVLFHYFAGYASPGHRLAARFLDPALLPQPGKEIAGYGWIGVEIFFVISGYVIAISAHGSRGLPFARRRLLRLWPAALICATLSLMVLWPFDPRPLHLGQFVRAAMLWPWGDYIDDSYWTLAIESTFYALVALLLWISPAKDRIAWLAAALGTVSFIFWIRGGHIAGVTPRSQELLLLTHGCYFAIGILLHRWHAGHRGPLRAAMLAVLLYPALVAIYVRNGSTSYGIQTWYNWRIAAALFSGAVVIIALSPRLQPLLERRLPRRPVLLLGLATYPLYLIHQTLGLVLIGALLGTGLGYVPAALTTLAIVTALALAIAAWAEPALRRVLDRALPFSPPSRGRAPDTGPSASPTGG